MFRSVMAIFSLIIIVQLTAAQSAWERLPRTAVTIAATGTTFDTTVNFTNARITRYILEIPNYTNTVTTTLSFINVNSVIVYPTAAHVQNANYSIPIDIELVGTYTMRLTLSGAAGAGGGTCYVTLFGQ